MLCLGSTGHCWNKNNIICIEIGAVNGLFKNAYLSSNYFWNIFVFRKNPILKVFLWKPQKFSSIGVEVTIRVRVG